MDIGSVPVEIGILPGYREVTGTPREPYGPSWALVERRNGQPKGAARLPPSPSPIRTRRGGRPPFSSFPLWGFLVGIGLEGSPTPGRSRTPPAPLSLGRRPLPPWLLYILR